MSPVNRLLAALQVIVRTPHIAAYLREHDPQALAQAERAIAGGEAGLSGDAQVAQRAALEGAIDACQAALLPADAGVHCGECNGTGKLTRLGGDWGKTAESEVSCWACSGTGRTQAVPPPAGLRYADILAAGTLALNAMQHRAPAQAAAECEHGYAQNCRACDPDGTPADDGGGYKPEAAVLYDGTPDSGSLRRATAADKADKARRIAEMNDGFRRQVCRGALCGPGRCVITAGIAALDVLQQMVILEMVATDTTFTEANDPHREHDFGKLEFRGRRVFWKIDYYADDSMTCGAEAPEEAAYRVLTVMWAEEY
jgi:Protein of unknown function (DUF3768)